MLGQLEPEAVIPEKQAAEPAPAATKAAGKPRSVALYCRPGWIDCRLARRFLDRNAVSYTEIDVRAMPDAADRVREWAGGNLVSPVFDIDGTIIVDFKRGELGKALGLE